MKTIQELCVNVATTETKIMAEKGRGFNNEEKKSIAKTLSLLFSKGELLEGLAFCYGSFEGELSEEAQRVANALFDVAWTKEFEMDDEAVYQEDRFGVPCEVLRYEEKYPKMDKVKATYIVDPSVPF